MYCYARKVLFCFFFPRFPEVSPDSNVVSGKIRSAPAPDLQMARFDLPLSALLQRLLLRAVRSLLLMRSLMLLNSIQVWSCTSVCVAQTKPNCKKSIKETAFLPSKQWFYCRKEVLAKRTFNCSAD